MTHITTKAAAKAAAETVKRVRRGFVMAAVLSFPVCASIENLI
jgi:hypothetical protein